MAADDVAKKKLPRDAEHLLSIEDQLKKIEGIIREIRLGMKENEMDSVELATGTIFHYLSLAEGLAQKYKGEYSTQLTAHSVKQAREKVRAAKEAAAKTRTRK